MRDGQEHFRHNKGGAESALGPPVQVISGQAPSPPGTALVTASGKMPARTG